MDRRRWLVVTGVAAIAIAALLVLVMHPRDLAGTNDTRTAAGAVVPAKAAHRVRTTERALALTIPQTVLIQTTDQIQ